jgi:hypothetical protein
MKCGHYQGAKKSSGIGRTRWPSIVPRPIDIFALNIALTGGYLQSVQLATGGWAQDRLNGHFRLGGMLKLRNDFPL